MSENPTTPNPAPLVAPALSDLATLIWGEHWQSPMARDLGINLRTVQRWAVGQGHPSPAVMRELMVRLMGRSEKAAALIARLGRWLRAQERV